MELFPFTVLEELEMAARLAVAAIFGAVIGFEREQRGRPAGLRTMSLVCLGSAAFTVVSAVGFPDADPSRVAGGIVTGIGFLGAGTIIRERGVVTGLTTAATIWTVAALGMLLGAGLYVLSIAMVVLALVVLRGLQRLER